MIETSKLKMSKEELQKGKIPIDVYDDMERTMKHCADMMVEEILKNNKIDKRTLLILPVGPVGQYKYFVERVNKERISLKNCTFINMDEYMQNENTLCSEEYFLSFRTFMKENVYSKIDSELNVKEENRIFPNLENAEYIDSVIENHGGVDICFGGIGINGHLAFNEPPEEGDEISEKEFRNLGVRVMKLSRETRVVNSVGDFAGDYEQLPVYAITIGLKQILQAKKVRLFCMRDWHRSCVIKASHGDMRISFPVSLLQSHKDARIGIPDYLA